MDVAARIAISTTMALMLVTGYLMLRDVQRLNMKAFPRDLVLLALTMTAFAFYRVFDGHGWSSFSAFLSAAFIAFQAWFVRWFQRRRQMEGAVPPLGSI
jgi:hypothetical protein